ncbi:WD40 repeat domain-containing protein [Streptomyces xylophagus]|uniref:WD40 repeat domain-containing protein n=1 Tax=Streptomyces xylophagus TaxID=285514 RepID=UPI0005BE5D71|nr:WD40 repeat domain-containing protein [Streptomyces xylophagus]
MPRAERPLDLDDGPLTRFAADLRKLREKAGGPPYRTLAKRAHYSSTTLSDAAGGRAFPSLGVTLAYVDACQGDRRAWESRWHAVAVEIAASAQGDRPEDIGGQRAPYAGLSAFQPEDADRFFGRERLTDEVLARVRDRRFLAVFGPSGSGKSSLLRAGLVARVRELGWPAMLLTPGAHPVEECAVRLAALTGEAPGPLVTELRDDPEALHLRIRQTTVDRAPDIETLIVADQFEEVFTLCRDRDERDAFIALLIAAATAPTSRTRVVLGVRADFYGHCVQDPRLVEAMRDAQLAVGPMSSQELREAITRPARLADCTVTGPLLAAVVADATGQPGALPLVSHAMVETWRRRSGNRLTLDGYLAAGGIQHALAQTAEAAYRALSPAQQGLARSLFLRLTALGDGTEDTRRRITADELDRCPDTAFVLESLARQRLVTLDESCVEITHEAIIRCWPRLRGWLTEDRERLLLHRQLTDATAGWEVQGRDPHVLWRGARLAAAVDLAAADGGRLTSRERDFVDASRDAQAGEAAAARRRTVRLRQLVTLLTVLMVTAVSAGVLAVGSRNSAVQQRNVAIARKAATDAAEVARHNPALGAQLNLAAYRLAATADVRDQLMSTFATPYTSRLTGHSAEVVSISFASQNTVLASASWDRTVRLWDVGNAHRPVQLAVLKQSSRMWSVAFGQGGRVLATASERAVRLWDVVDRRAPVALSTLPDQPAAPTWVAFRPDGDVVATGHTDGTTRLWNVTDPRHPRLLATLTGHTGPVTSAAFGPDGRTLATTGDTTARLWDVTTPAHPRRLDVLRGHTDTVTSVAFSPDGRTVATGSWDHTARVWRVGSGPRTRPPVVLLGHPAIVWSVAFSPDGRTLVSIGGSTLFWDITDQAHPKRVSMIPGGAYQAAFSPDGRVLADSDRLLDLRDLSLGTHDDVVTSLAFAPGGHVLASASWDGTARLWQVNGGRALWPLAVLRGHTRFVRSVAFSPDGRTLVTASEDTTARVWDVTEPRRPRLLSIVPCHAGEVAGAAFGPGGHLLAVWAQHGAGLWDLTDPRRPRPLSRIAQGGPDVTMASLRPDGRTLVTSTGEVGSLRFWDIREPRSPRELPSPFRSEQLTDGMFSPDNRSLAAVHLPDRTVWLMDVGDLRHPSKVTRLWTSTPWLYALAFSPDGRRLVAGAADGKVLLWDVGRTAAPAVLTGHSGPVPAVAFGPHGDTLATGGNDFTIRLWDTGLDRVAARVCDSAYPRITRAEWARYFTATDFQPPCPAR